MIRKKNEVIQKVNKRTGGIAMACDIFCTERVATLFDTLTGSYGYKRIAAAVGVDNAIVRIGQFDDGTNVYVLPKNEAPVLVDSVGFIAAMTLFGSGVISILSKYISNFISQPSKIKLDIFNLSQSFCSINSD